MDDDLRIALIIIGALILGALLLHGLWTIRKNGGQPKHRYYDDQPTKADEPVKADGFDELGVGAVRVVKTAAKSTAESAGSVAAHVRHADHSQPLQKSEHRSTAASIKEARAEQQAELPFEEANEPQLNFSALAEDEARPDEHFSAADEQRVAAEPEQQAAPSEPAEVLILYVLLPEHAEMKGPDLLSALLTLGFKYGDMDIFHRHIDSAGSGAVLFSLANMFNPGTFDLENIDKLSTRGVSLFMTLPGPGEALQNFNLMHNAAKKLADEFGGQVLDGQRSVLTVQTVRHYVDKIREFQRQLLIHG